ncbi:MAG: sigma 54-interacting transcriptional regulator, partial [Acidobacteriota bacterium]
GAVLIVSRYRASMAGTMETMSGQLSILVAHPLAPVRGFLCRILAGPTRRVIQVNGRRPLKPALEEREIDLLLVDLGLLKPSGPQSVAGLREGWPGLHIIVLAEPDQRGAAARCLGLGADDFMILPLERTELLGRVGKILKALAVGRGAPVHPDPAPPARGQEMVCHSPSMQAAFEMLKRIAPTRTTVLILGESGVGTELFARAIHYRSPRRHGPWIPLNCSALPESIIESELFGHEKGAFTGAVTRTRGRFEMGDGGTVFLDEIGEMNRLSQAKLLRVLEDREVTRIGGSRPFNVDVRLLAATNTNLEQKMQQGLFREDLFHRLNVITLRIPPLRNRREDLPQLAEHFLRESIRTNQTDQHHLHPEVLQLFQRYTWPGNVRELKNLMENLALTAPREEIRPADLPARIRSSAAQGGEDGGLRPGRSISEVERDLIECTLAHVNGNRTRAAGLLRIGIRTLQRKIRFYGLS